jgi:ATP-binding cassette subfamily C (CFTR/MRP) protein 1
VEEGGANFSGGERQLINIARTLLDPKKVVLVDEATASIDFKSDEMLQKVIRDQFAACTVITIAHRITTILSSDRILVLDKGHILELDSPSNLLKDPNSTFFKLYKESQLYSYDIS